MYKDRYYGTLKSQVEVQLAAGQNVVFDVDVVGGCNIKKFYGDRALSVFIQPPSVEELPKFDKVIVNDDLEQAKAEALQVITEFLSK